MSTIKNVYPEWDGKSKLLNIELVDPKWIPGDCVLGFDYSVLFQDEVKNIRKSVEDFAIDVLIKYFFDNKIDHMVADIGAKEKSLEPAKEINGFHGDSIIDAVKTMEDIEKELGYKIKIVNRKED